MRWWNKPNSHNGIAVHNNGDTAHGIARATSLRIAMFVATYVVLLWFIAPSKGIDPHRPADDEIIATQDYKADVPFESLDLLATHDLQQAAADKVPPVYRLDQSAIDAVMSRAKEIFDRIETRARQKAISPEQALNLLRNFDKVEVPEETLAVLLKLTPAAEQQMAEEAAAAAAAAAAEPKPEAETDTSTTLSPIESPPAADATPASAEEQIRPLSDLLYFSRVKDVTFRVLKNLLYEGIVSDTTSEPNGIEIVSEDGDPAKSRHVAAAQIEKTLSQKSVPARLASIGQEFSDETEAETLKTPVYNMVMAAKPDQAITLVKDEALTAKRIQAAKDAVEPVTRSFKRGQIIIRSGNTISNQTREDIDAWFRIRKQKTVVQDRVTTFLGNALLLLFGVVMLGWLMDRHFADMGPRQTKLVLLTLLIIVFEIALAWGFRQNGRSAYYVPLASGVILAAILVDAEVALMVALFTSVLVGRIWNNGFAELVTLLGGSLAGLYSIRKVRRRSDIMKAGIVVAGAGAMLAISMNLISNQLLLEKAMKQLGNEAVQAAVNGVLVVGIVMAALPFLESAFKIVTDIRLLEFSDLDNPLLQRMLTEVPGTYHHSMVIGLLAQNAADAIGANSVLARVGAYYHDIGKLVKPEYFSENQEGVNKHDELSPTMSSRIITSHVKQGLKLAEEYKLPQPIRDIIAQHHGTNHVSFFYQKAQERNPDTSVLEEDFRYPGPRPQSREAAIVMLADSIE
ncbi:MAG: HDIG domain-containing protein, partial [Candidatus Hydrogenedentes bacterium]|nr:HDIG domain-containing protein [Candidatus Hydrogenedentota bacterium]